MKFNHGNLGVHSGSPITKTIKCKYGQTLRKQIRRKITFMKGSNNQIYQKFSEM